MIARTRTATPEEQRLLDELVHLRIGLELGDALAGRDRASMITRLHELETHLTAIGLLGGPDDAPIRRAHQPAAVAPIEPE